MPLPKISRIIETLRATELFESLPDADLNDLALRARHSHVARGEVVFTKRVGGANLYCVFKGRLKITTVGPRGNELLLALVDPGELCGEVALIDGAARSTNAVADRPSELLALNRRYVLPVLERNPKAAIAMSRILSGHLRAAISIMEDVALLNAKTRLLSRLMSFAQRYSSTDAESGALRIEHGLSQQGLADSAGLTRVMVNRQLGAWREQGLIESGRGYIVVLDREALEAAVLGEPAVE